MVSFSCIFVLELEPISVLIGDHILSTVDLGAGLFLVCRLEYQLLRVVMFVFTVNTKSSTLAVLLTDAYVCVLCRITWSTAFCVLAAQPHALATGGMVTSILVQQ